jgi:hypothetical protein
MTGWKHNHGRVRLVGPPQMTWMLRKAGFVAARFGALDHGVVSRRAAYRSRFYATVATAP